MKAIIIASVIIIGAGAAIVTYKTTRESIPQNQQLPPTQESDSALIEKTLNGTYRCWSYNVGGRGASCASSQFVFHSDGTYSYSTEKGTYKVSGNTVSLSVSKIRGLGILSEGDLRLTFSYSYNGLQHTVTYLKR